MTVSPGADGLIYDISIRHVRRDPVEHSFEYHSYLWLIDVDSPPVLPHGVRWLANFKATDHLSGYPGPTLRDRVDRFLTESDRSTPATVLMLANARSAGYVFDPLTVFWCFAADGTVQDVIAEVHNTYGGQHAYLLETDSNGRADTDKAFYVSPFYPVDGRYELVLPVPDDRLAVAITLRRDGERPFTATVTGRQRRGGTVGVLRAAIRTPLVTWLVAARIRRHGIALYLKGLRPVARRPQDTREGISPSTPEIRKSMDMQIVDETRWPDVAAVPPAGVRARIARSLFRAATARLPIRVVEAGGKVHGAGGPDAPVMWLARPDHLFRRLGATGLVGFGEAFQAGDWEADELADVLTVFAKQMDTLIPPKLQRLRELALQLQPEHEDNTIEGARANIHRHYDLSNELFTLFLDPTMTYSSALFDGHPSDSGESLTSAQHRKIDRLLDQAAVGPGSRLLEIGTGWGELALRAAERGASVVSVTISVEQRELAMQRIAAAGYADSVDVRLQDYRQVEGQFDAIVSVEMIEAVGANHWTEYFQTIDRLLAPGGRVGLQAITMPHDRMIASMNTYTWIRKYIFPGGQIASTTAIEQVVQDDTSLRLVNRFGFGAHYAETLRRWRATFEAESNEVDKLGFDETFRRMWSLYLAYSEAGFRSGYLDVYQYSFDKPRAAERTPDTIETPSSDERSAP